MITREEAQRKLVEAERAGNVARANYFRNKLDMPPMSSEGARFGDRTAVETARGPGAAQATLENRYPQGGVRPFGPDNFIMPGPQGGDMLMNPPGFDTGDLAFVPRALSQVAGSLTGGFLGGAGGFVGGGGVGVIPGAMLGAGVGGELAGQGYDALMRLGAGTEDTRGLGQRATDTAVGVGLNSMGGPMFRQPAYGAQQMDDLLFNRARQEMGMPALTAGQTGSRLGKQVEGALESTLSGGPVLDRQRQGVESAFRGYLDNLYPQQLTRQEAGGATVAGVDAVVGTPKIPGTKKWTASQLYEKFNEIIDQVDGGNISLPRGRQLLAEMDAKIARDPEYAALMASDPDLVRYVNTLRKALDDTPPTVQTVATGEPRIGAAGLEVTPQTTNVVSPGHPQALPSYNVIKEFRTSVGEKLESPFATALGGGTEGQKRYLYGVLSDDLAAGAEELGGQGAVHARTRADTYYRTLGDRLALIDPVFKHADNPTRVYEGLENLVRHNPKALAAVKKTMPADAWDEFTSTYMRRLMSARPGADNAAGDAVSYHTIATNLNKLVTDNPEAYKLLAGDKARALENVRILANRFRESEQLFNRSRTANSLNFSGVVGTGSSGAAVGALVGHSPASAVAGSTIAVTANLLIPWLTAKVVTSPIIRKAMDKMPAMMLTADVTPGTLARSLMAAGANESDVAELLSMEQ